MVRILFPKTQFVGSFIATSPGISIQQNRLGKWLILIIGSKRGHMGIRINKVCPTYKENEGNEYILDGGPVEYGIGFHLIHSPDFNTTDTSVINSQISITRIKDPDYINNIENKPKDYVIANGYMAWIKGQLEEEMINGLWVPTIYNHDVLFNINVDKRWRDAYKISGITPEHISIHDAHT